MAETQTSDDSSSVPEFLINQKTLTCLAVIEGTDAQDAVIGMERYNASVRQQWFPSNGQWQWGGNQKLCLAPKGKGNIQLAPCDKVSTPWTLDKDDRLVNGSVSLGVRVAKPSKPVKLWPKQGGLNKKWWTFSSLKKSMENVQLTENSFPPEVMAICRKEMNLDTLTPKDRRRLKEKEKDVEECFEEEALEECLEECLEEEVEYETDISEVEATAETPEYLVSQSNYMCLTVINGSTPKDAIIGVAPYTGSTNQQWFVSNGRWQWGGNRKVCLEPNYESEKVGLAENDLSSLFWKYDKLGLMISKSHALEVSLEGKTPQVNLHPRHGGISQKWWTLSSLKPYVGKTLYPFSPLDEHIYKQEVMKGLINRMSPISEPLPYPRDISRFPGTVAPSTPRINRIVTLELNILGQRNGLRMRAPPRDWQATSLYVAAGDLFSVILPETITSQQAKQIKVRVGAQTDNLNPNKGKMKKGKKFKRMPAVSDIFDLNPGTNILRSQYGGSLIFVFREGEKFEVIAEVHNAVEAPHYIIHKTSDDDWKKMKKLDAPYSILEGERVVLVAPTSAARKTPKPEDLLKRYDKVVSLIEDLAGFDENDPAPRRKHWLVDDLQISGGNAHAGFPVMFERKANNIAAPSTPHSWVTWHELGHNYQQPRHWCNVYGAESTVNLFSVYVQEKLKDNNRLKKKNLYFNTAEKVDKGLTFKEGNNWAQLVFLMEIKDAYPKQGWDMFRHLNRTTRALSQEESKKLVSNKDQQYDYVYKVLSQYVGADLIPHYQRWGLTISEGARHHIQELGLPKSPSDLAIRTKFN